MLNDNKILSDAINTLAVLQWVLTFIFMGPFCGCLMIYMLFTRFWWLTLVYGIYYLFDRKIAEQGGRQNETWRNWQMWKSMARYFPVKLVKTTELNRNYNYLLGYHPHGVLNTGGFLNFAVNGTNVNEIFKGFKTFLTVLAGHFDFPIYRDYTLRSGLVSVKKSSIRYLLEGPRRRSSLVVVVLGGANEALDAHPNQNRVHLTQKTGFFKLALETGTHLVPVYSFGENNCYNQLENKTGTKVRKIQDFLTKYLGFSLPLFHGYGLLPLANPITTVVGSPIFVEKIENPSIEDIIQLRMEYIQELTKLFEKYKPLYAPKENNLEII